MILDLIDFLRFININSYIIKILIFQSIIIKNKRVILYCKYNY